MIESVREAGYYGAGKAGKICIIQSADVSIESVQNIISCLDSQEKWQIVHIVSDVPVASELSDEVESITELIAERGIRHCHMLTFGMASLLFYKLYLTAPKLVRTVALCDPVLRPEPSEWQRIVTKLDRFLPLGLPFRSSLKGFDPLPFLHKIRCPALLLKSEGSSEDRHIVRLLTDTLPVAWQHEESIDLDREAVSYVGLIERFFEVPPRSSQKNLQIQK